jgi:septal ring factor EnvC (AmiA/AmiB activator)
MEQSRPWASRGDAAPEGQAPPPPAPELDEDARPATAGELRGVRRWSTVATVWAVAASVIALVALLDSPEETSEDEADTAAELTRIRRALDRRIDPLRSQVGELPTADDLQRLEGRVRQANRAASDAAAQARGAEAKADAADQRLDEFEQRLEELEQQQQEQAAQLESQETQP